MFKAIKEFFLGKPAQAPAAEAPYKVEVSEPVAFTPPPKAADVVVEAAPVVAAPVVTAPVAKVSKPAAKKPVAKRAPAKKPAAKKPAAKKPVTK